jgi:hypothetical protein
MSWIQDAIVKRARRIATAPFQPCDSNFGEMQFCRQSELRLDVNDSGVLDLVVAHMFDECDVARNEDRVLGS